MAEEEGPTLADQFKTAREKLQADLRRIERAEQILAEKPELVELLETISHIRERDNALLKTIAGGLL